MHLQHSLGLTALTSALVADAFLLPSSLSWGPGAERGSASNIDYGSHMTTSSTTKTRTIKLACPGCSFPEPYGKEYGAAEDEQDASDNSILLNFTVSDDGHKLLLNDESIYSGVLAQPHSLYAHQVPSTISTSDLEGHADSGDILSRPRQLIYTQATRSTNAADGSDASMTDIEFGINGLDDESVEVDRLAIRLLGDEEGILNIVDIINVPLNHNKPAYDSADPSTKTHDDYELVCEGRLAAICRMRAFMEDRFNHMRHKLTMSHGRPCPHKMQHGHRLFDYLPPTNNKHHGHHVHYMNGQQQAEEGVADQFLDMPGAEGLPLHGGVEKFRPYFPDASLPSKVNHHFHGHHHRHRNWRHRTMHALHVIAHSLHRVFVSFFIPVLIGIAAGMIASMLGMFVGTIIAWAWIKFVRGGKRGNASGEGRISLNDEQHIPQEGEKAALMKDVEGEVEAPPVYVERE